MESRGDVGTRAALRAELLRALEACERGLAAAWDEAARAAGLGPGEQHALVENARRHLEHAQALRARRPGGGGGSEPVDTLWVAGLPRDPSTLAEAERRAWETLHDCLIDLDPAGRELLLLRLLPDHLVSIRVAFARAGLDENAEGGVDVPEELDAGS